MEQKELLRSLPKVDELLNSKEIINELGNNLRPVIIETIRETLDYYRKKILSGELAQLDEDEVVHNIIISLQKKKENKLKRVVNTTGVIIHTNLGRSVLCKKAVDNVLNISKYYSNLEYDIEEGKRGSRYSHVEELIKKITGAQAA